MDRGKEMKLGILDPPFYNFLQGSETHCGLILEG